MFQILFKTFAVTTILLSLTTQSMADTPRIDFKPLIEQLKTLTQDSDSKWEPPRIITLDGEINPESAILVANQLKMLDKFSHQEIEIDITSPGGIVYAGLIILGQMDVTKSPIKTVCYGYCMSMAASVLAHGTPGRRFALPYSTIMIHQVAGGAEGSLSEMRDQIREASRLMDTMAVLLAKDTGFTKDQVLKILEHPSYLSPEEAKGMKLIDQVLQ